MRAGGYSFTKNMYYVALAFVNPRLLIGEFCELTSLWYGVVPWALVKGLYELLYVRDHLLHTPVSYKIVPVAAESYHLFKALFAPVVEVVDLLLFAGMLLLMAKLLSVPSIRVRQAVCFFMFTFSLSLAAAVADAVYQTCSGVALLAMLMHPLAGLAALAYMTAFVHKQAGMSPWRSLVLVAPAWVVYFFLRLLFFMP